MDQIFFFSEIEIYSNTYKIQINIQNNYNNMKHLALLYFSLSLSLSLSACALFFLSFRRKRKRKREREREINRQTDK